MYPLQVIRDLELMPQLLGQDWSSVFLQKFEGSVTWVLLPQFPSSLTFAVEFCLEPDSWIGCTY